MMEVFHSLRQEYENEKMPVLHQWRSRLVPLDALIIHNASDAKTYNRLFYNEADYTPELDELKQAQKEYDMNMDYTDPQVQQQFRSWMEAKLKQFPGIFTREGEAFNYESFFRNAAIMRGHLKPSAEMSEAQIAEARAELEKKFQMNGLFENPETGRLNLDNEEEAFEGKNTVGINMPKELAGIKYKAWMA
jgi:hypothetical protein